MRMACCGTYMNNDKKICLCSVKDSCHFYVGIQDCDISAIDDWNINNGCELLKFK